MRKILIVAGTFAGGGVESVIMNLLRALPREDFTFDMLVTRNDRGYYDEELSKKDVRIIHTLPIQAQGMRNFYRTVFKLCRENSYDAVHINSVFGGVVSLYASYRAGIKNRVYHAHNTQDHLMQHISISPFRRLLEWLFRSLINRFCTVRLACGIDAGRYVFGKRMVEIGEVEIIHNAVDTNMFHTITNDDQIADKQKRGFAQDTIVLGQAGRFTLVKNQIFSIKLVELLIRVYSQKVVLLMAGAGEEEKVYKKYVRERELEKYVVFLGQINDMGSFYREIDVFLLPSLYEGLPVTVVEAQASGVPSILSDCITRECDLGIELVHYCSLNDETLWVKTIKDCCKKRQCNQEVINQCLREHGYNLEDSVSEMEKIYEGSSR